MVKSKMKWALSPHIYMEIPPSNRAIEPPSIAQPSGLQPNCPPSSVKPDALHLHGKPSIRSSNAVELLNSIFLATTYWKTHQHIYNVYI